MGDHHSTTVLRGLRWYPTWAPKEVETQFCQYKSARDCRRHRTGYNNSGIITPRSQKHFLDSFQIQRIMIVETVFLLIMNQTKFSLVHIQKVYCHYDHIPLNLKRIKKLFIWIHLYSLCQSVCRQVSNCARKMIKSRDTNLEIWCFEKLKLLAIMGAWLRDLLNPLGIILL